MSGGRYWGVVAWEQTPGVDRKNPNPALRTRPTHAQQADGHWVYELEADARRCPAWGVSFGHFRQAATAAQNHEPHKGRPRISTNC
jgi:hypothetical protein